MNDDTFMNEDELVELFRYAPKESFELLLRNIKIRKILEDLYFQHKAGIELKYDDKFDEIFEEIFRFFFRPVEMAVFGAKQLESFIPFLGFLRGYELQKDLNEAYNQLFRSIYDHYMLMFRTFTGSVLPEHKKDLVEEFVIDYAGRLKRYFETFTTAEISIDWPFLLPKNAFSSLEKSIESWKNLSLAVEKFRQMMKAAYIKGANSFIEIANSKQFESYQDFANAFYSEEEKVFDELVTSQEYLETQSNMQNNLLDYTYYMRTFFEELALSNPVNPFATISLLDKAFERIYELKRKITELEKRIRKLEGDGDAC